MDELLTVKEVAGMLNVPVSWIYERTRKKGQDRLPHVKLGKYLRFDTNEVHRWLQTNARSSLQRG
jgi:excisionase family DNA binding protein